MVVVVVGAVVVAVVDGSDAVAEVVAVVPVVEVGAPDVPVVPDVEVDESFRQRPAYQEGFLTDEPDLSVYDEPPRKDHPTDEPESEDRDG